MDAARPVKPAAGVDYEAMHAVDYGRDMAPWWLGGYRVRVTLSDWPRPITVTGTAVATGKRRRVHLRETDVPSYDGFRLVDKDGTVTDALRKIEVLGEVE